MGPSRSILLGAAALLVVAHVANAAFLSGSPRAPTVSNLLQLAGSALLAVACAHAARRGVGAARRIWGLAALALASWSVGQALLTYQQDVQGGELPGFTTADVPYFFYYLPLLAALFVKPDEEERREFDWVRVLDVTQVGLILSTAYLYFFFFEAAMAENRMAAWDLRLGQIYNLANALVLGGFLARAFWTPSPAVRRVCYRLALFLAFYALGDGIYSVGLEAEVQRGGWLDLSYTLPLALGVILAATWNPAAPVASFGDAPPRLRRLRFSEYLLPALAPLIVLSLAQFVASRQAALAFLILTASFVCFAIRLAITQQRQERALAMLEAVNQANTTLARRLNLEAVLETLLDCLGQLVPFDSANVMLLDGEELVVRATRGYQRHAGADIRGLRLPRTMLTLWEAIQSGSWVLVADTRRDPRWVVFPETSYVRCWLGVPLQAAGKLIGFYSLDKSEPGYFTPQHARLAESLAAQAAVAIENARLFEESTRAHEEVRRSEQKFSLAFYSHPAPMVLSTLETSEIIDVNESYLRFFGYTRQELIGRTALALHTYVRPEDRAAFVQAVLRDGKIFEQEVQLRVKSGEIRTVLASADLISLEGRRCILGVIRDITERRVAEAALRVSEEKFAKAWEASPDAISISTLEDGRYLAVNESFFNLTGYRREEAVGRTVFELGIWDNPIDRTQFAALLREHGRVRNMEVAMRKKTGERVVALVSAEKIELDESPCLLAFSKEITDRKRAEEALRASEEKFAKAFRASPTAISLATRDEGRFLEVNDGFLRFTGYTREEVIGRRGVELALWVDPQQRLEINAELEARNEVRDRQVRIRKKNGQIAEAILSAELIELRGTPCLLVVSSDITERKALEAQLQQAQKMEAIGQLAGGVAHDFNNLLGVIIGYADMLMEQVRGDPGRERPAEAILSAAQRASALTRQLLAFSRRQVLRPRVLDLSQSVQEMGKLLGRLIGENIVLHTSLEPALGHVKADPSQIEQVLMNLAVNARDAMPNGGRLTIQTANVELDESYSSAHAPVAPGRYVMLAVSDTGIGMDAATQARIFEPFFTTKEPGKGTGLGLATVYGIVKQSEGYIWVYSEVGKGTAFKVYLPRVDQPVDVALAEARPTPAARVGETVLLVEDDDALRELTRSYLDRAGYSVVVAANGQEALTAAVNHNGDLNLLVTDVVLPGMSGPELARQLDNLHPGMKVLFVSGYTDIEHLRAGVSQGEFELIQKPFRRDDFTRRVRAVLDRP
jgi:PAS domain S-box-containing protein